MPRFQTRKSTAKIHWAILVTVLIEKNDGQFQS
jgi:hypothetical protein